MKKNFYAAMVAACLIMGNVSAADAQMMIVDGVADNDTLNIRSGPGASYADVGDLQPNQVVRIRGYDSTGKWARIRHQGQIAYVAARFLTKATRPDGSGTNVGPHKVVGIKANDPDGGLVVREGDGRQYAAMGVLPNGSQVHVIQRSSNNKWAMISYGSGVGWVGVAYLKSVSTSAPEPMPSPTPDVAPDGGPLPALFTVDVAWNDTLNLRDAPSTAGSIIGQLQPGSVIQVVNMASGNWAFVTDGEHLAGYVNITYLNRGSNAPETTANGFILGIACVGTEPFWGFDIADDRTVMFNQLIGGPAPLTSLVQTTPSSQTGLYPFGFSAPPYSGLIQTEQCSDGMSDNVYTMSIVLNAPGQSGGIQTLQGCCNVQP